MNARMTFARVVASDLPRVEFGDLWYNTTHEETERELVELGLAH